ncbi:MAG: DMT family transporter [Clostridia bacterium]|nr:DMT family transporter [Clostridia bacterium]
MIGKKLDFNVLKLLISYIIFGSVGIFVGFIPLPSSVIASFRGITGGLLILLFLAAGKKKISRDEIKLNARPLILSGVAIGFNWIFLFEAYRFTSIATATLCYYMAPVFVIIAAPIFLKEKIATKNIFCVLAALLGMFFISNAALGSEKDIIGILFGLSAALLYAVAIICNKKMGEIAAETRAMTQLLIAGVTVLPYAAFTAELGGMTLGIGAVAALLIVGVVHTGFAYVLNLGSVARVKADTVAVLSYTDPIVAILLESIIDMTLPAKEVIIGALLILGATAVSSINLKKN